MPEARDPGPRRPRSPSAKEREEYDLLLLLERLESLVEEMDELGVASRAEVVARIAGIHSRLEAEA
jgi:hypothetical protein